jgi:hypothetical protein
MRVAPIVALLSLLSLSATLLQAQVAAHVPPAMTECEKNLPCITLHFMKGQAEARWSDGTIANLTIESYDGQTIKMKREDSVGLCAGLHGEYVGSLENGGFKGKLTWNWPGHGSLSTGSLDWTGAPWQTSEPVRVPGAVAQTLEKQFAQAQSCSLYNVRMVRAKGTVEAELTVSPTGNIISVKDLVHTVQAPGCHGVDTLGNIAAWTFKPYLVNGKPTAMVVTVHFDIDTGHITHTYK